MEFDANGAYIWIEGEQIALSASSKAYHDLGTKSSEGIDVPTVTLSLCSPESASTFTVDESREWVLYLGQRYLWIPKTYRGRYQAHGQVLVCGGDSGRMSFIFEHRVNVAPRNASAAVERAKEDVEDNEHWMLMAWDQPALYHPFI
jgi:hypothetical protein